MSLIVMVTELGKSLTVFVLSSLTPPSPDLFFLARGGFFGIKKLEKEEVLREGGKSLREMRE